MNYKNLLLIGKKVLQKNHPSTFFDLIEHSYSTQIPKFSKILKICHYLPTSSSPLEQSFSRLKFIQNNLPSNLKEETLQSLLFITQKYQGNQEIIISPKLIQAYDTMKEFLSQRKSNGTVKRKLESYLSTKNVGEDVNFIEKKILKHLNSIQKKLMR